MSDVSEAIKARLAQLGWDQKQLAYEWQQKVNKGTVSTFETHGVSRLVNDDPEGFAFVLDGKDASARLRALAEWLGWEPETLKARCEAARVRPVLVLHPDLPQEQVAFFQTRERMDSGRLRVVPWEGPDLNGKTREALRDTAKRHGDAAVVVVPHDKDREFFDGADVRTSRIEASQPGFRLVVFPDLTPPLPPRTKDVDGMPMVAWPQKEREYRSRIKAAAQGHWRDRELERAPDKQWVDRIREADAEGTPATFRLDWLLETPTEGQVERLALQLAVADIPGWPSDQSSRATQRSFECFHGGRLLAIRAPDADRRESVAEHLVEDALSFAPLVASLRAACEGLNPYLEGPNVDVTELGISTAVDAFTAETGLPLHFDASRFRPAVGRRRIDSYHPEPEPEEFHLRKSTDADAAVRALLDDVLAREFILPTASETAVFQLEVVRSASLVHLESTPTRKAVLANIGAGRVMRVDILRYVHEKPGPVRLTRGGLDGGDVRMRLSFDERKVFHELEGTSVQTVLRRRQAEDDD